MANRKPQSRCCDAASVVLPDDPSAERLRAVSRQWLHPARVRIVRLLISRKACVCGEIVDQLPFTRSRPSHNTSRSSRNRVWLKGKSMDRRSVTASTP